MPFFSFFRYTDSTKYFLLRKGLPKRKISSSKLFIALKDMLFTTKRSSHTQKNKIKAFLPTEEFFVAYFCHEIGVDLFRAL
jgi:hypothetical protein